MARSLTYDGDAPQRLNRWLAQSGVCSRREAEALIARGLVTINGARVEEPGRKVGPGDAVVISSAPDAPAGGPASVILNKPVGYVSGQPEPGQTPAVRLVRAGTLFGAADRVPGREARLAPVGRLDLDSRGLLLLSEDGVVARAVIGPDSTLEKEYLVTVEGRITDAAVLRLRSGLTLDGRVLKRAGVTRAGPQRLRFVLTEGRNRQIRRMCGLVGLTVTDLVRIRIGPIELADLPEGRWRPLSPEERQGLIDAARPPVSSTSPRR